MKYLNMAIFVLFLSLNVFSQTQIGNDIDGEAAQDVSGGDLAISADGTIIAVGGPFNSDGGSKSGHVRVFEDIQGVWTQLGTDVDGQFIDNLFGSAVDISANGLVLATGGPGDTQVGSMAGHVRIFDMFNGDWLQIGNTIDGAIGDEFGTSVSLSNDGTTVAIGAPGSSTHGLNYVKVYENVAGSWQQVGNLMKSESIFDDFGRYTAISADGNTVAISGILNDGNGADAGYVQIYKFNGTDWVQVGTDIDGEFAGDQFGTSISLSADGTTFAAGSVKNSDNGQDAGHTRVFKLIGSSWVQLGADIDGEAAFDQSGGAVSLSSDGQTVAIGSSGNSTNSMSSGVVRIYEYIGGAWVKVMNEIYGEAAGDRSGDFVALSADASTVMIGAQENDGTGISAGHTRVFNLSISLPVELINFWGEKKDNSIHLCWETASEQNNEGFHIERSDDGQNWITIGYKPGNGTTSNLSEYKFVDTNPQNGTNLYRLKQEDFSGTYEYSNIIEIECIDEHGAFLYPNPTQEEIFINLDGARTAQVRIVSMNGQTIREVRDYRSNERINLSRLVAGHYIIQIHMTNGKRQALKFTKIGY